MIKIGVTGGIGSGKTIVSEIFKLHGIPIFNADEEAKKLNDSSPIIREQLTLQVADDLYPEDKLDRKKLASIIFHDNEKRAIVNAIIHPVLANRFIEWVNQHAQLPFVVLDAALLIEAGFNRLVDNVIIVQTPKPVRIARVMKRDNSSYDEVEARINSQLSEEEKQKYAHFVISNNDSQSLLVQVSELLSSLDPERPEALHS